MNSSQHGSGRHGKDAQEAARGRRSARGGQQPGHDAMPELRDNQQMQDDNQTSGESVVAGQTSGDATQPTDTPNQAANKEPAEGSRETVNANEKGGGITNRSLEEERENQERVPPRGDAKGDSHA